MRTQTTAHKTNGQLPLVPIEPVEQKPGIRRAFIRITPEHAAKWLNEFNTNNRPLTETRWMAYAIDMLEGRWAYNGDAIRIDANGVLLDGQHRLRACVESKVPLDTDVVMGIPPEARRTIDIHASRTTGQIAHMDGIQNANNACAIVAMLLAYKKGQIDRVGQPGIRPTKTQINEAVRSISGLQEAIAESHGVGRNLVAPRISAFCLFLFCRQNQERSKRFFDELSTGLNLSNDNPAYRLRERLIANRTGKAKLPAREIIAIFFRAWAAYRDGKTVKSLRWRTDGPTPEKFPDIGRVDF